MNIKKTANLLFNFAIKRLAEIFGISISLVGVMIFLSLITYSPDDPNFIFPDNTKIHNLLGFQGSYISDLFFQSIGVIAYLLSLTLIITGINVFRDKNLFLIIENIFFAILYCNIGSLFFDFFHQNAFDLYISGNGGFVGQYLSQTFFSNLINLQKTFFYYFLIILVFSLFLISINFNLKKFIFFLKRIINFFSKDNGKSYTNKSEIINEYIPQDEIKNLIQEDLPFIKAEKIKENEKTKFKLPSLDLLKTPTKKERENSNKDEIHNPEFLEKILLDFGVNGTIN